jgi:hypothetical protein
MRFEVPLVGHAFDISKVYGRSLNCFDCVTYVLILLKCISGSLNLGAGII